MKLLKAFRFHAIVILLGLVLFQSSMSDFFSFLAWWLCLAALGVVFLPLADLAFGRFKRRGYMFAKTLGLAAAGYLQWLLSTFRVLPFRTWSCYLVVLLFVGVNVLINRKTKTYQKYISDLGLFKSVANQEALFMGLLLFWAFLRALRPEIEGLEKFMDFGFLNSILRSDWFPAPDMWLAGEGINYYYLGHYFTAFLTRLTSIAPAVTYNLMMATLFALPFMLAYSVAEFLVELFNANSQKPIHEKAGVLAGVFAGLSACVGGNLHAAIFAVLFPSWNGRDYYWLSDATRYIGYNPDWPDDKTIHEFPVYSSIVSDLHAHVINMLFVLTAVALAVALAVEIMGAYRRPRSAAPLIKKPDELRWVGASFLLAILFVGLFLPTNFWDYPIYVVFIGAVCLYANLKAFGYGAKAPLMAVGQMAAVAVGAYIVSLPFQMSFDSMGTQIKLAQHHSMIRQLGVLWGYQVFFGAVLAGMMVLRYRLVDTAPRAAPGRKRAKGGRKNADPAAAAAAAAAAEAAMPALYIPPMEEPKPAPHAGLHLEPKQPKRPKGHLFGFIEKANPADMIALVVFICATGLFIIPELIFVVDIYPAHPRSNTMFKLGYQAFILFGLGVGYTMVRLAFEKKELFKRKYTAVAVGAALFVAAMAYPFIAIGQWYGQLSPGRVIGLDGTSYMLTQQKAYTGADGEEAQITLQDDHALVTYINENIQGSPAIAEAFGDAYTLNGRISANTGLPNILNWYYHEFLWRNSNGTMLDERKDDINGLYTSGDSGVVRGLLDKYDIRYIVVGQIERLKYPGLDEGLLREMGDVVFSSGDLYMLEVRRE